MFWVFVVIVVVIILVLIGKNNEGGNNTLIVTGMNEDPSFKKEWIEWRDGEFYARVKYANSSDVKTYKIDGTYKMEGDQLVVYADSKFLGSQGVTVKIGWVDSNKIFFTNKDLVPYHNKYVKEFFDGNRSQFGNNYCDQQIELKQTSISEMPVAFIDVTNNSILANNGAVIATYKGNPMEAAGTLIAMFFEGWPPLSDSFEMLCRFWISEMSRQYVK